MSTSHPLNAPNNAAEAAALLLAERGVTRAFVYAAASIKPLLDAIRDQGRIMLIHMRSETTVAFAAAGYARASGEIGVCITGGGPATTSMITGIFDAHQDSVPLILLTGQVATARIGSDAWQETDAIGLTASVTKHNFQPRSGNELLSMVDAGLVLASSGRPGPVFIDIPTDVLSSNERHSSVPNLLRGYAPTPKVAPASIESFYRLLSQAKRPLLLLGGGCVASNAGRILEDLAESLHLPVVTTMTAKGAISETHPQVIGLLGSTGKRSAVWAYQESDLVIAFGTRFAERLTGSGGSFQGDRTIIHIDIDAVELGKNTHPALAIEGDCAEVAQAIFEARPADKELARFQPWLNQCAAAVGLNQRRHRHQNKQALSPERIMDMINQRRRSDQIVVIGSGEHHAYAGHYLTHTRARTFIASCGAGARGFGLPAAIGASVADESSRLILLAGDVGFQSTIQELANVHSLNAPILILILDNGAQAREMQDDTIPTPDFVSIAKAYGIAGHKVEEAGALEDLLDELWNKPEPALIHIKLAATRMIPHAAKGESLSDAKGLFTREELQILQEVGDGGRRNEP